MAVFLNINSVNAKTKTDTIYIIGGITTELSKYITALNPTKIKTVHLYSDGGDPEAAIAIAKFIHDNKIETYVGEDGICYSSCTIIYQAGIKRFAHKSAEFMYHYARNVDNQAINEHWSKQMFDTLMKYKINKAFIQSLKKDQDRYVDAETSKLFNVVVKLKSN